LSLSAIDDDCLQGLGAALFAHQNCVVAVAAAFSSTLPRAASTMTSASSPSSMER
jgi:hypothetical protein